MDGIRKSVIQLKSRKNKRTHTPTLHDIIHIGNSDNLDYTTIEVQDPSDDLEKSIEAAPLFTAKLKADRLKTQKTAHEN